MKYAIRNFAIVMALGTGLALANRYGFHPQRYATWIAHMYGALSVPVAVMAAAAGYTGDYHPRPQATNATDAGHRLDQLLNDDGTDGFTPPDSLDSPPSF
jgi:hypothetical protein